MEAAGTEGGVEPPRTYPIADAPSRAKRWRVVGAERSDGELAAGIDPKREVRRTGALGLITSPTPHEPPQRGGESGGGGGN